MNFRTYVFFDIETTGLPKFNLNKSNIIELSFVTNSEQDLIELNIPKVENKLTLLFNPRRIIHPNSSKYSGLDNYMLENEKDLNENAVNIIIGFLIHLNGPICLVAHNGNNHDFPIFKTVLDKLNIKLPENIYCIDSLPAFQHMDKEIYNAKQYQNELLHEDKHIVKEELFENEEKSRENFNEKKDETEIDNKKLKKMNETTPNRLIKDPISRESHQLFQTTPSFSTPTNLTSNLNACKRRLSFSSSNNNDNSNKEIKLEEQIEKLYANNTKYYKSRYKLVDIYERICGKIVPKELLHHSENDAKILQEIIFWYGKYFVEYVDKNAKLFSEMKNLSEQYIQNL